MQSPWSLGPGVPLGAGRGRRPRGQNIFGCFLVIVVILAGLIWAYFAFWQNRALERAGQDITITTADDPEAFNTYKRRMRDYFVPEVRSLNNQVQSFVTRVRSGQLADASRRNEEMAQLIGKLRQTLNELNSVSAPNKQNLDQAHRALAVAIGYYYKALVNIKEAYKAETEGQKKKLLSASLVNFSKGQEQFNVGAGIIANSFR